MTTPQSPALAARDAAPAAGAGPIVDYLTEQLRRQHIAREVLQRQQIAQIRSGPLWQQESVAREIRDVEAVEHWLAHAIRDARGAQC